MKKILILTAGYWQAPVISCAKSLGLYVVATDANPNAACAKLADKFICIDSLDVNAIEQLVREEGISGILAESTDVAVEVAAVVAERCGLVGIGSSVAKTVTNKKNMRDACSDSGVPIPRYCCVENINEALSAANKIGYPVIIKPTDSQSSKGVAKIFNSNDLISYFPFAIEASREKKVLIEEMLLGRESSVESFFHNDLITVLGISEKVKSSPPYSYDIKLVYPANYSKEIISELERVNALVIQAVGIPFGIVHAEYIITNNGIFLIEVAARGCGAGVASTLIPALTGFNPIKARILMAMGEEIY